MLIFYLKYNYQCNVQNVWKYIFGMVNALNNIRKIRVISCPVWHRMAVYYTAQLPLYIINLH
jgi:hypothetical protein